MGCLKITRKTALAECYVKFYFLKKVSPKHKVIKCGAKKVFSFSNLWQFLSKYKRKLAKTNGLAYSTLFSKQSNKSCQKPLFLKKSFLFYYFCAHFLTNLLRLAQVKQKITAIGNKGEERTMTKCDENKRNWFFTRKSLDFGKWRYMQRRSWNIQMSTKQWFFLLPSAT